MGKKVLDEYMTNEWQAFSVYLMIDRKLWTSKKTIARMLSVYKQLLVYFADKAFNRENFNAFMLSEKQRGMSNTTLNKVITLGKHYDKWKKYDCLTDYTYFREENKAVESLTYMEISAMIDVIIPYRYTPDVKNHRYSTLILFLATTGCRLSEVLDLQWKDVGEGIVRFIETKNGDTRIVPISDKLQEQMRNLLRLDGFVFSSDRGGRMNDTQVRADFKNRALLCGIRKEIFPHVFRHSFITEMIKQGVSISYISRIVGHKDLQSTNHYTQLVVEDLRDAIYFHPLLRPTMTLEKLTERIQGFTKQLIDTTRYTLTVVKESSTVRVTIAVNE